MPMPPAELWERLHAFDAQAIRVAIRRADHVEAGAARFGVTGAHVPGLAEVRRQIRIPGLDEPQTIPGIDAEGVRRFVGHLDEWIGEEERRGGCSEAGVGGGERRLGDQLAGDARVRACVVADAVPAAQDGAGLDAPREPGAVARRKYRPSFLPGSRASRRDS